MFRFLIIKHNLWIDQWEAAVKVAIDTVNTVIPPQQDVVVHVVDVLGVDQHNKQLIKIIKSLKCPHLDELNEA